MTICEGDLYFGDSGAAIVALGIADNSVYAPSCIGIVVGGHRSRPDFWLLNHATIMAVLDIVRFMTGMTLAEPDAKAVQAAQQHYTLWCTPLSKERSTQLLPYRPRDLGQMNKKMVHLTDAMIAEFDKTTVPRRSSGATEHILFVGRRPAVVSAAESCSKDPKVQDLIKDTA